MDGGTSPGGAPIVFLDAGTGSAERGDASAFCAATVHEAEGIQLDMLIVMDGSGSMKDEVAGGAKWALLQAALDRFSNDPASAGIGVGVSYFGVPVGYDAGDLVVSCDVADYAVPAVAIATLPQNAPAIVASLAGYVPQGGTPTRPALAGGIEYANAWLARHGTHRMILVLATDGEPNDCESTVLAVSQVAADALAARPSVQTYVIGVGESLDNLDQIAAAGGTDHAYIVDTSSTTTERFVLALNSIRGEAALPCQYEIPVPDGATGRLVDFESVNVAYTESGDASRGTRAILLQVPNDRSCDTAGGGWYYDDPSAPTSILLCSSTCARVKADIRGRVDVLVGCKTQRSVIR
ncbi:MAG TPA: vWA domain-containing protein [Polyangiaceae bacterium]